MFKKVEALNKDTHQNLRFTQIDSFEFASSVLNAPLSASEFLFAARYYPIVFSLENATPQALFTLGQQKNHYVNTDGLWSVPYIPAHIRRYPFILANTGTEESGDKFAVCIDVEAPHFATDQGTPLFTADGNPGDFTQKTMTFLQKFQEELKVTQALCMEMESMKVLVEKKINIEKDGQKIVLGGFRCVDMEKLTALDDSVLAKWVRNGLMGIINLHQLSLGNLKNIA